MHADEHHLDHMRDDVLRAAALEAVDADRRHAAIAALVNADRKIEVLGRALERLVSRIVQHPIVVGVGPQEPPRMPRSRRAKRISATA
jgi:hypothetical protein